MSIPSLEDYMRWHKGAVPKDFCDELINRAEQTDEWHQAALVDGGITTNHRNCSILRIERWPDLDTQLFHILHEYAGRYTVDFPFLTLQRDEGYGLLKYTVGQFYLEHVDHASSCPRALSCVIGIGGEFEGGDLVFWGGKRRYRLDQGDILLFPASFMYPHAVEPVTKGVRYSLTTWFL
jgi:predicted 2-oxoglutarate/Fe(II)-dependent dioxygenase YbiX